MCTLTPPHTHTPAAAPRPSSAFSLLCIPTPSHHAVISAAAALVLSAFTYASLVDTVGFPVPVTLAVPVGSSLLTNTVTAAVVNARAAYQGKVVKGRAVAVLL